MSENPGIYSSDNSEEASLAAKPVIQILLPLFIAQRQTNRVSRLTKKCLGREGSENKPDCFAEADSLSWTNGLTRLATLGNGPCALSTPATTMKSFSRLRGAFLNPAGW
jgi:hypothetical protein